MVDDLLTSGDRLERFLSRYCVDYFPAQWHWRPMKINKRCLKEAFSTASWALFTDDAERAADDIGRPASHQLSTSPRSAGSRRTITSVSYSYLFPVKVGLACDVFFFGDDPSLAASHAILHADRLATVWKGHTVLELHVGDGLDIDRISREVEDILGRLHHTDTFVMGIRRLCMAESKL
jgi:hypothetical protein